jgi:transcription initiation factor TFIIH subunit 1
LLPLWRGVQEAAQAKLAMGRVDPTVNVAADDGERLGGGFGALRDGASDLGGPRRRTALDSIAKDVNRHAAVVLEGAPEGLADLDMAGDGSEQQQQQQQQGRDTSSIAVALAAQQKAAAAKTAAAASAAVAGDGDSVSPERLREWQERAASALDDLTLDERHKQYTPLNITDPRSYFDSTAAAMADGPDGKQPTHHHHQQQQQQFTGAAAQSAASADAASALLAALDAIQPLALPNPPCDPDLASAVVLELSQDRDEELIREFGHVAAAALQLPPQDRTHGVQSLLLVSACRLGQEQGVREGRCMLGRRLCL